MSRRRLALALAGLALLALVTAGRALAADDATMAGLPGWAVPTGGGLGVTLLGVLVWSLTTGRLQVTVGRQDERRADQPGRRAADEEGTEAIARARAEGRAEAQAMALQGRIAALEGAVEELQAQQARAEVERARHEGDHRTLTAQQGDMHTALIDIRRHLGRP